MTTLYIGVYVGHPDYQNALLGIATPAGTWSGEEAVDAHNGGNYNTIYTSWTISRSVANHHAYKSGTPGVVLIKTFKISQTVPSPDIFNEAEYLILGIVTGAKVTRPNNKGTPTAW